VGRGALASEAATAVQPQDGAKDAGAEPRARYLDLLEKSVRNAIYGESRLEMAARTAMQRLRHPYLTRHGAFRWPARAHTMLSAARLRNLRNVAEQTILEGIPGDYIETGVWRGGACILLRGVLAAYGVKDRKVICADSFEGLPAPDPRYAEDRRDRLSKFTELAISEAEVRANFAKYDLLDDQVVFLKGFFRDTLKRAPAERFALLRLDGDMYESTMDALTALYDRLSPSGFVIIDDYGGIAACRKAVHDFLDARSETPDIRRIDETGVWWRKPF